VHGFGAFSGDALGGPWGCDRGTNFDVVDRRMVLEHFPACWTTPNFHFVNSCKVFEYVLAIGYDRTSQLCDPSKMNQTLILSTVACVSCLAHFPALGHDRTR